MGFLRFHALAAWAFAVALAACGDEASQRVDLRRHELAIVGGQAAVADQFPELALIYNRTTGRICTGTLVAPDAVITAAHCTDGTSNPALDISVYFDTIDMRFPGITIALRNVIVPPEYATNGATSAFDVAILELTKPLTDRRSAAILPEPATIGDLYLQVGFGRTDPAKEASYGQLHYYSEASSACAPYQLSDAKFICFREDDGTGVCDGDSGGPIFRKDDGGHTMVGIVSFGRGDSCRDLGVGLQIATNYAFLKQHLGSRMACAQDGVCDNTCDDQGTIDLDCQVCEAATDCKQGDFCIAGDCVPPKNADLADPARGGMALRSGCRAGDLPGRANDKADDLAIASMMALTVLWRLTSGRLRRRAQTHDSVASGHDG